MTIEADFALPPPSAPAAVVAPPTPRVVPDELPPGAVARLELLLREPDAFLAALARAESAPDGNASVASLTRVLVGAVVVGAGLFGAVVGAHRGALQMLYCTLKVPLILLVTLAVCAAPFVAFTRAARLDISTRAVIALALGSCARFALVLVGLAPFVWLMEGWSLGYHRVILAVVAVCAVAGAFAGRLLFSGLARHGAAATRVGVAFVAVFALTGAQTSWILRPFVVRPRTEHIPFVRSLEGDFLDALGTSAVSAARGYSARGYVAPDAGLTRANQRAVESCAGPSCE